MHTYARLSWGIRMKRMCWGSENSIREAEKGDKGAREGT